MRNLNYQQKGSKQERFDESKLTGAVARRELLDDIDFESKRVNVDSAKKLACI